MRKLFLVVCVIILVFGCSSSHKYSSNDNDDMKVCGQTIFRQVNNFTDIPTELLSQMEKTGVDSSLLLNEYEGKYLNFIFKTNSNDFNLVGKNVSFSRSKIDFFKDERERYYRNSTPVGGATLYIFNDEQKAESGGYDAAIIYWSKFYIRKEKLIEKIINEK